MLDHISLKIKAGTRVAIVGRTGSGKSTVARLLTGLYDPTEGYVRYNAVDLKQLDRTQIRRQVGIVVQDGLFSGGDAAAV